MTYNDFLHSTPNIVKLHIKTYWENKKNEIEWMQYHSWLTGQYVLAAINSAFGKHCKYPPNPLQQKANSVEQIAKNNKKSEAEIRQNLRYLSMRVKQANAEIQEKRKALKSK